MKELKLEHPDWDSKRISEEAGKLNVVRVMENNYVRNTYLGYGFVDICEMYSFYRALKIYLV